MKNTLLLGLFFTCIFSSIDIMASDDVYDAPTPKKEKIKQVEKTTTTPQYQTPSTVEKTVPYLDEENSSSQRQSSYNNTRGNDDEYYYSDDYSGSFGYTDRIRRFHNPSIQFNIGWSNWNNYYDPWYSSPYDNLFGWNNWNNYSFTPSWMYSYNSFYNPFWNTTTYIIFQPGISSWYNTGYYSPWNSWNSYYPNYGFSPYCNNLIFNNNYNHHNHYNGNYETNNKNIIYTPRTGTYNNTYNPNSGNSNNTPSNPNNNNGGWNINNNSNSSNNYSTPKQNKWTDRSDNTNSTPKGSWSNPYKNNDNDNYSKPSNNNNNWNNSNSNSNNNSGIKIGSRPK